MLLALKNPTYSYEPREIELPPDPASVYEVYESRMRDILGSTTSRHSQITSVRDVDHASRKPRKKRGLTPSCATLLEGGEGGDTAPT